MVALAAGATQAELDEADAAIAREMDDAITFADKAPAPPMDALFRDVFAPGEPEPEPLQTRIDRILARA